MAGRSGLALSRGALKALVSYSWPGNIRELKHLIITAAVMAEGNVIQVEQLGITVSAEDMVQVLEQGQSPLFPVQEAGVAEQPEIRGNGASQVETALPEDLNRRQVLACKYVREHGSITSKELIDLLDATISKRTAGYDIQGLVDRGLLVKKGRGPSTRYVWPTREDNA